MNMLSHVFSVLGMTHDGGAPRGLPARRARRRTTSWSSAPGPATRATALTPRSRRTGTRSTRLLASDQPFLAVCLGHQVLCDRLGIPLAYKDIVFQGTQSPVDLFGRHERVGFYNTFVARSDGRLPEGVRVAADPETGDIHVARRSALPRHPVPRRVDPHRARLPAAARPAARPAGTRRWLNPGSSWSTTTTPTPGTSSTWSRRSPAPCPTWSSTTGWRPDVVRRLLARGALAGARTPGRRALLLRRPRDPAHRHRPGAGGLPGHAGPRHGVRREGRSGCTRPTARSRSCGTTARGCSPAFPTPSGRCATTRSRPSSCPRRSGGPPSTRSAGWRWPSRIGSGRCSACSSTPSRSSRSTAPTWSANFLA